MAKREYECESCGETYEVERPISASVEESCPKCQRVNRPVIKKTFFSVHGATSR